MHQKKERLLTHYNSLYGSDVAVSRKAVLPNLIYDVPMRTAVSAAASAFGRLLNWLCRLLAGLHSLQLQFPPLTSIVSYTDGNYRIIDRAVILP